MKDLVHVIKVAKYRVPALRTLQLIINAVSASRPDVKNEDLRSVLYDMEDTELVKVLAAYGSGPLDRTPPVPADRAA